MDHFTQLNLQGKSAEKSPTSGNAGQPNASTFQASPTISGKRPGGKDLDPKNFGSKSSKSLDPKKMSGSQKAAAIVATFVCTSLLGAALLETSGCSQSKPAATIATPTEAVTPAAAPAPAPTPAPTPQPVAKKVVKKAPKRIIPVEAYKNSGYGLAFRYPNYDSLREGDNAQMQWDGIGPVEMNFVQPGGMTLSTVELPDDMFPNTDYDTGFFTASVNPKLTEAQCSQFTFAKTSGKDAKPMTPAKVKLGKAEFSEVIALVGDSKQAEAKYYHTFQNGACYEFTLGLQTASANDADGATPLDPNQVFARLRWILKTVDINPEQKPAVAANTPATTAPATTSPATGQATSSPATTTGELMKPAEPSAPQSTAPVTPAATSTSQPAAAPSAPAASQPETPSTPPVKVIDDRY